MKTIALYIYQPTTIITDTAIEPLGVKEPTLAPGKLVLQPGIYRVAATAQLDAVAGKFDRVALSDDKGQWPDPPGAALKQFNKTSLEIHSLLGGAGKESEV